MSSGFFKLAAQIHKEQQTWTPVSALLRNTTSIQLGSNWLVVGGNNAGLTATALEFLYEFNKRGYVVYFFDIGNALFTHRLTDLDCSRIIIIRPNGPEELAASLQAIAKEDSDPILIFDSLHLFREKEVWKIQNNLDEFLSRCYEVFKNPTIVATERDNRAFVTRPRWKNVLQISYVNGWSYESEKVGHTVSVNGRQGTKIGSIKGFIDYRVGRYSKRYFEAMALVDGGKSASTAFEFQEKEIRGLRNFVIQTPPLEEIN